MLGRILAVFLLSTSALAQPADVANHAVPVGRGPGVIGWGVAGPCSAGQVLAWTGGATSDPACAAAGGSANLVLQSSTITGTGHTTNQLLYENASNLLDEVVKCNSGFYITNGSGVPSCSTTLLTLNAGTNFGITAPGAISPSTTVSIGATTDNLRFADLGLGVAASTSGGQITSTLGANNITGLLIKRNTDAAPTGKFEDFQNAAGTSLWTVDITGAVTTGSWTGTTIAIANGGTGQTTKQAAFDALAPTASVTGDLIVWSGTHWINFAGNASGTQCLQENSSGTPAWGSCGGSSSLTIGTTAIASGGAGRILYDSGPGTLQETASPGLVWDATNQALALATTATGAASALAITGQTGILAASQPLINGTQTWNAAGVVFTGLKFNFTNTASNTGSLLIDLQLSTVSQFKVDKGGNATALTSLTTASLTGTTSLLVGTSSQLAVGGNTNQVQNWGTTAATGAATLGMANATAGTAAHIDYYRSKAAAIGTATVVASGDDLGELNWWGAQQTGTFATQNVAAQIRAEVDGTVTSGAGADMPGRLVFSTTPDGSGTLAERVRIDSVGQVLITSAGNLSLAVGRQGSITPTFSVDSSTGSQTAGLKVTGAALNGTVAVAVTDTSGNTNLTINALGAGTIGIGTVSTGIVTITSAGSAPTGTGAYVRATAPTIAGGSITALTTFALRDTSAAFDVTIAATSAAALTAGRTLTIGMDNVAHTLKLGTTANTITFQNATSHTVAALDLASQTVAGGANVTSLSQSTGNITVDCGARPLQSITNNGAWQITAPANDGSCILLVTNGASAATPTYSGFSPATCTGDTINNTNTNKFSLFVWRINGTSGCRWAANQ